MPINATSEISIMRTAPASTIGDIAGTTGSAAAISAASARRCGAVRTAAGPVAASIMLRASNCPIVEMSVRGALGLPPLIVQRRKVVKKVQKTVSATGETYPLNFGAD